MPEITDISLLTSWTDSGDFDTNAVDSIGEGGVATVGFVFDVPVHDGEVEVRAQVDVFDSSGSHVGTKEGIDNRLTGQQGVGSFEWSATFDSRAWQRGSYTARVLIQDRIGGKTSPEEKTDFEVVESLGSSEVEYVRHIGPETVTAGESFSWEVEVRNIVDRDSTLISPMSQNYEGQGWDEIDTVNLNIPGNNDEARFGDDWTLDGPGSYNYRLDDARDVRWSIEVE